jgi:hypothetical protein
MALVSELNTIMDPYLFQVVGSTPESVRDSIKSSALKNNPVVASRLVAACIFAAAVNKPTLENFIARPELADARPIISSTFSLTGKANMTGLTLLGHCLLTSPWVSNITFAQEFRKKMGQQNIWEGNLEAGSISDTQKKIFQEKKRLAPFDKASLLGRGFFKFTGLENTGYTRAEAVFWGVQIPAEKKPEAKRTTPRETPRPAPPASPTTSKHSPPTQPKGKDTIAVPISDTEVIDLPADVVEWYRKEVSDDPNRIAASINRDGASAWLTRYREAMAEGLGSAAAYGSTVV